MERQQGHGSGGRAAAPISIGVDVGGTFTDVVWVGEGRPLAHMKVPTTRAAPGAVISADLIAPPSQSFRSRMQTLQPALESRAPQASELIPLPTMAASNRLTSRRGG